MPVYAIDGSSLGAAFAIALRELFRRGPSYGPRMLSRPRSFFLGLRPRCAVTGAISAQRPATDLDGSSGTPGDRQFWLESVGGMQAKLQVAAQKGWRLVAPYDDRPFNDVAKPDSVHVDWAASVREADRYSRRVRPARTLLASFALLALIGGSVPAALALSYRTATENEARVAASQRAAAENEARVAASQRAAAASEATTDLIRQHNSPPLRGASHQPTRLARVCCKSSRSPNGQPWPP